MMFSLFLPHGAHELTVCLRCWLGFLSIRHVAKPPVSLSHAHQSSLGPSGDTSAYANGVGLTQVTEHMDHVYAYCVLHMLADGYDVIPQPVSVIESKDGQLNGRFGGYPYKCAVLAWYRHHTMSAPMHTIHTNTTASTATNTTASTATENMKRSCILSGQGACLLFSFYHVFSVYLLYGLHCCGMRFYDHNTMTKSNDYLFGSVYGVDVRGNGSYGSPYK